MAEDYVNREVFDSEIRRIEQKVDNAVERIELKMDVYTARMDSRIDKIDSRVDKLEMRLDGISSFVGWTIGIATIIITVGTFVIQVLMKK